MNKKLLVILILVVVGTFIIFQYINRKSDETKEDDIIKVSYGNVQVTVIYLNQRYPELSKPAFYLRLDTHSGDLYIYDIKNSTVLEVGGRKYYPISWKEDDKSWSHHRIGILEFPEEVLKDIENTKTFRLVVKIERERILEWKI